MNKENLIETMKILVESFRNLNAAKEDHKAIVDSALESLASKENLTGNVKKAIKKTAKAIAETKTKEVLSEAVELADIITVLTGETAEEE